MVTDWVVFCDIIHWVFLSLFPEYVEIVFWYSVSDPIKYHLYCSGYFYFSVLLMIMFANLWSVATGVGGCWWPISAKGRSRRFSFLAVFK